LTTNTGRDTSLKFGVAVGEVLTLSFTNIGRKKATKKGTKQGVQDRRVPSRRFNEGVTQRKKWRKEGFNEGWGGSERTIGEYYVAYFMNGNGLGGGKIRRVFHEKREGGTGNGGIRKT